MPTPVSAPADGSCLEPIDGRKSTAIATVVAGAPLSELSPTQTNVLGSARASASDRTVAPTHPVRRRLTMWWHGSLTAARGPGWIAQLPLVGLSFMLLAYPWWKMGTKAGIVGTATWVIMTLWKTWIHVNPKHMKLLARGYAERKLALYMLIQDLERAPVMTDVEVHRFQRDALSLIAKYVRDHRLDRKGTEIFVNLLVAEGDDLVVVARDRPHRADSAQYARSGMIAAKALDTGNNVVTGDVYVDYPETPPSKPYRSIMAIPVRDASDTVLGVVSIDSSRRYHFDAHKNDLGDGLAPYVALLAWTLNRRMHRFAQGAAGA